MRHDGHGQPQTVRGQDAKAKRTERVRHLHSLAEESFPITAGRNAPEQAHTRRQNSISERRRGAGDVATDHRGDGADLRRRKTAHGEPKLLPPLAPFHHIFGHSVLERHNEPGPVRDSVGQFQDVHVEDVLLENVH